MARLNNFELTADEIANAFPDECLEYLPKAIKILEVKMLNIEERLHKINTQPIDDGHKQLKRMFVEFERPGKIVKRLEIYKKALDMVKKMNDKYEMENKDKIEKAKNRPIANMVVLKKEKVTASRVHGCCPFGTHEDSNPSFVIYRHTNTFHCFSCKVSGDAIDFYKILNNASFGETINILSK